LPASPPGPGDEERAGLIGLALTSFAIGACAGLLGAAFRLTLQSVEAARGVVIHWAHGDAVLGFVLVVGAAASMAGLAAWMVRRFAPHAAGSGIPQIEVIIGTGKLPQSPLRLILVKFIGGALAIGGGLALGREGPSVQMGGAVAQLLGNAFRRSAADCRVLIAAGAGAGLATAFNAPIAGAVFVLEELVRRFEPRIAVAALGASATAIAVARVLLGQAPDFHVPAQGYPGSGTLLVHLALGLVAGLFGALYCGAILAALRAAAAFERWPHSLRAAVIGAGVGVVGWFAPGLVGGGEGLTQRVLDANAAGIVVAGVFVLRLALGAVSYAAGTPGGLFAPMLVLGAQVGVLFALLCAPLFGTFMPSAAELAIVSMAAFFCAVVRAPLTGIILVTELTASFTLLLPMLGACFVAMIVPSLLGVEPIYDSLRDRLLRAAPSNPER